MKKRTALFPSFREVFRQHVSQTVGEVMRISSILRVGELLSDRTFGSVFFEDPRLGRNEESGVI